MDPAFVPELANFQSDLNIPSQAASLQTNHENYSEDALMKNGFALFLNRKAYELF